MSERLSAYDHMQLWAGRRMMRENTRGQMFRSASVLAGMVLLVTIDAANVDVDACAYTIEGSKDSLVETVRSFDVSVDGAKDLVQLECTPTLG